MANDMTLYMRILARGDGARRAANAVAASVGGINTASARAARASQIAMRSVVGSMSPVLDKAQDTQREMADIAKQRPFKRIISGAGMMVSSLRRVNSAFIATAGVIGAIGRAGGMVWRGLVKGIRVVFAPLRQLRRLAMVAGAAIAAIGVFTLKSSADIETLRLRIGGVTRNAAEAKAMFDQTFKMSIPSPFTPEELIKARIGLLNLGLSSKKALTAIGDTSAITRRDITDLVAVLSSLEIEPLRRIGIEARKDGDKFSFIFRNKMREIKKITAAGIDGARQQLLKIFDIKYGGGMKKFADTFEGLTSTLKGMVKLAGASFGDGLMPVAKRFITYLNTQLNELVDSGKLADWGQRSGEAITTAFDYVRATVDYTRDMFNVIKNDSTKMADSVNVIMSTAGEILAISVVNYLRAAGAVFRGIGKILAGAFLEDILQLPFMGGTRRGMATEKLQKERGDAYRIAIRNQDFANIKRYGDLADPDRVVKDISKMSVSEQAKLAASGRGDLFKSGIEEFTRKLPQIAETTHKAIVQITRRSLQQIEQISGSGNVESIATRAARYRQQRLDPAEAARMADDIRIARLNEARRDYRAARARQYFEQQITRFEHSTYGKRISEDRRDQFGNEARGAAIIIQSLTINSDNARDLQNDIMRAAGSPAMVGGT